MRNITTIKHSATALALLTLLIHGCATVAPTSEPSVADDGIQVDEQGVEIDPFYQVPDKQADGGDSMDDGTLFGRREDTGEEPPTAKFTPSNPSRPTSGTVLALLSQAKEQEKAGNSEKAAAVLERALRIDPRNAELWYRLALLRLQQGRLDLARSFADKSMALAQGNDRLLAKNRTIIEQVQMLQGSR
jgi:tetratricopeptide (TPR) repeat protein